MYLASLVVGAAVGLIMLYAIKLAFASKKHPGALPPGPKPLPIIGNIADLPPAGCREWEHWTKHKDLYGELVLLWGRLSFSRC